MMMMKKKKKKALTFLLLGPLLMPFALVSVPFYAHILRYIVRDALPSSFGELIENCYDRLTTRTVVRTPIP